MLYQVTIFFKTVGLLSMRNSRGFTNLWISVFGWKKYKLKAYYL